MASGLVTVLLLAVDISRRSTLIVALSASQLLYLHLPYPLHSGILPSNSAPRCYLCGGPAFDPQPITRLLKSTFTDYNVARGDAGAGICAACAWWMQDKNTDLQTLLGRDKPQKARNYSLFLAPDGAGEAKRTHVLSKAQKREMASLLLSEQGIPDVAVIAVSGQKHLVFKARVNPPGQRAGWVLYEEQHLWLDRLQFGELFDAVQALYRSGYSKEAIETGRYTFYPDSDRTVWRMYEPLVRARRGSIELSLAVYLAQMDAPGGEQGDGELDEHA